MCQGISLSTMERVVCGLFPPETFFKGGTW